MQHVRLACHFHISTSPDLPVQAQSSMFSWISSNMSPQEIAYHNTTILTTINLGSKPVSKFGGSSVALLGHGPCRKPDRAARLPQAESVSKRHGRTTRGPCASIETNNKQTCARELLEETLVGGGKRSQQAHVPKQNPRVNSNREARETTWESEAQA